MRSLFFELGCANVVERFLGLSQMRLRYSGDLQIFVHIFGTLIWLLRRDSATIKHWMATHFHLACPEGSVASLSGASFTKFTTHLIAHCLGTFGKWSYLSVYWLLLSWKPRKAIVRNRCYYVLGGRYSDWIIWLRVYRSCFICMCCVCLYTHTFCIQQFGEPLHKWDILKSRASHAVAERKCFNGIIVCETPYSKL